MAVMLTGAGIEPLPLQTEAAILVEMSTGRVLYERNMHQRMYPASMTKILTALLVLEHLDPDDVLIVGPEIRNMPAGYATGVFTEGSHVTVRVLLKGLLIRSVNEAGRVLALHVVQEYNQRFNLDYLNEAKPQFADMMNDYAQALGARDSNFTNPYGLHHLRHFTTAYDLALISRAFMADPLLAEIAGMWNFTGDGLEGQYAAGRQVQQFNWTNTNQMLPNGAHGHPFVTGMRTGYTTPAGECLAASAYHNGLGLITIVFDSANPGRWNDTRRLLDHGFANYAFRTLADGEVLTHTVQLDNPRLEDDGVLSVFSAGEHTALLSVSELATLQRVVTYDPTLIATPDEGEEDDGIVRLRIPLGGFEEGDTVGWVNYLINDAVVFTTGLYAAHAVLERTFDSDMDFWIYRVFSAMFSRAAVPYWFGVIGFLFGFICLIIAITISRRARGYGSYSGRWRAPRGRF
ncbi:MAG: D-alanyl-D-alanine carboxypeptidase [Defluviitaleaceae bacterium]|nr:D-alanyl-D-alanine carboxypeptidase [Defluviitaleaceae bacterium]